MAAECYFATNGLSTKDTARNACYSAGIFGYCERKEDESEGRNSASSRNALFCRFAIQKTVGTGDGIDDLGDGGVDFAVVLAADVLIVDDLTVDDFAGGMTAVLTTGTEIFDGFAADLIDAFEGVDLNGVDFAVVLAADVLIVDDLTVDDFAGGMTAVLTTGTEIFDGFAADLIDAFEGVDFDGVDFVVEMGAALTLALAMGFFGVVGRGAGVEICDGVDAEMVDFDGGVELEVETGMDWTSAVVTGVGGVAGVEEGVEGTATGRTGAGEEGESHF